MLNLIVHITVYILQLVNMRVRDVKICCLTASESSILLLLDAKCEDSSLLIMAIAL